jgi:23S rRNA (pseudouridine1915-N3)-methyltransferase
MKIKIIYVGKNKKTYVAEEIARFMKLLGPYVKLEFIELKESKMKKTFSSERCKDEEAAQIMKCLEGFTIALDEKGKEFSSREFSTLIERQKDSGATISFIIGGAYGLADEVKNKVDMKISLSKMTFTHQMVRVFLLEQLYRSICIINGKEYHND